MKNTEKIKTTLSTIATLSQEDILKKVGELVAMVDEDNQEHAELVQKHADLAMDYGKLVVRGAVAKTEEPPTPTPQSLEQIVDSVLKKGK